MSYILSQLQRCRCVCWLPLPRSGYRPSTFTPYCCKFEYTVPNTCKCKYTARPLTSVLVPTHRVLPPGYRVVVTLAPHTSPNHPILFHTSPPPPRITTSTVNAQNQTRTWGFTSAGSAAHTPPWTVLASMRKAINQLMIPSRTHPMQKYATR